MVLTLTHFARHGLLLKGVVLKQERKNPLQGAREAMSC